MHAIPSQAPQILWPPQDAAYANTPRISIPIRVGGCARYLDLLMAMNWAHNLPVSSVLQHRWNRVSVVYIVDQADMCMAGLAKMLHVCQVYTDVQRPSRFVICRHIVYAAIYTTIRYFDGAAKSNPCSTGAVQQCHSGE
jgi:hypothetical protein